MNLFETVKASVSVPAAARMYGLQPNHHGMVRCPFHDDRHPSMKLTADFGIDPDKPPSAEALAKPRHPMIRAFRDDERYCQRVLCDYLHLLEDWRKRSAVTVQRKGGQQRVARMNALPAAYYQSTEDADADRERRRGQVPYWPCHEIHSRDQHEHYKVSM